MLLYILPQCGGGNLSSITKCHMGYKGFKIGPQKSHMLFECSLCSDEFYLLNQDGFGRGWNGYEKKLISDQKTKLKNRV